MEPSTWNLLFGWITGRQCFIPEGCGIPAEGILVYSLIPAAVLLAAAYWKREELTERWQNLRQ